MGAVVKLIGWYCGVYLKQRVLEWPHIHLRSLHLLILPTYPPPPLSLLPLQSPLKSHKLCVLPLLKSASLLLIPPQIYYSFFSSLPSLLLLYLLPWLLPSSPRTSFSSPLLQIFQRSHLFLFSPHISIFTSFLQPFIAPFLSAGK